MKKLSSLSDSAGRDFVPETYWDELSSHAGRDFNEFERRIRAAISTGDWSNVRLPSVRFGLEGGNYLPKFLKCEIEIARLSLESTTWDVKSIRARPTRRGIAYRVVDEYNSKYSFSPKTTRRPLSTGQLVDLIEGLNVDGMSSSPAALRAHQTAEDANAIRQLKTFVIVSSDFYPSLEAWYAYEAERWVKDQLSELPRKNKLKEDALKAETVAVQNAAQLGDPTSLTELGYRHFLGKGVARSISKAIDLWRQAASLGDPRSTFNLAVCLQDGIGGKRQPEKALKLYEQLAEQDFYVGLKMAGFCRHVGIGCIPDRLKALQWYFEMAKGFGVNRFASEMVNCLRNTDHKTKLEQDAISWIRDAAKIGSAGQNMLRSLNEGPAEEPVAHDAGIGYLGVDPLVRVGEKL
jgi:TPR repeat protein